MKQHGTIPNILIASNNPDVGTLVTTILQRRLDTSACVVRALGVDVLTASLCANIDLVITEEWLADMSAYDLSQALKTAHPKLPVLLLTTLTSPESTAALARKQFDGVLTKPFHINELAIAAGLLTLAA